MYEITLARVEAALEKVQHSRVDNPDAIVVPFGDFSVLYQVTDQLLTSTARWRGTVPTDARDEVQAFVLERNAHLIAPTMSLDEAGILFFKSDHPLDGGLDDEQLAALVHTQLQLHAAAAGMCNQRFPQLVDWRATAKATAETTKEGQAQE